MDYMIKIINCSLIGLVSGGDACICYGYKQEKLPYYELKENYVFPPEATWMLHKFLELESWCYNLVCNKPQPFDFWSINCSFVGNRHKGTPLMFCGGGRLFTQYTIVTPNRDGVI